ncbi:MAG: hypothetical protein EOP09_10680, partial [Proteobacteria bacterium]
MKKTRTRKTPSLFRIEYSQLGGKKHFETLARNLKRFEKHIDDELGHSPVELPGQPLDSFHLQSSRLYLFSRQTFLQFGGTFHASLLSSERSLRSSALLSNEISYTPHEDEVFWAARENPAALETLSRLSTSLFHEQNHRILWHLLKVPAKLDRKTVRKFFNFVESLVVTLDMMGGDELGTAQSAIGYQLGVLYDPGTDRPKLNYRERMNYYHLCLRATYLHLEGADQKSIRQWGESTPMDLVASARTHALDRSLRLDDTFVDRTNPLW